MMASGAFSNVCRITLALVVPFSAGHFTARRVRISRMGPAHLRSGPGTEVTGRWGEGQRLFAMSRREGDRYGSGRGGREVGVERCFSQVEGLRGATTRDGTIRESLIDCLAYGIAGDPRSDTRVGRV